MIKPHARFRPRKLETWQLSESYISDTSPFTIYKDADLKTNKAKTYYGIMLAPKSTFP